MKGMGAWLTRHLQTLIGSLGRLSQQPLANGLTILVIGIALALPACLHVLVANARSATGDLSNAVDISVYLKSSVSEQQATEVAAKLRQRRDVARVELIAAEAALKEFREYSGFGAALDALSENPLPHTLIVRPGADYLTPDRIEGLGEDLKALPEAELVQLDTAWVNRLQAILDAVRRGIIVAAVLLAVGVMVIVGNTIRLDIQNRRDEIEVTKLVGGSDAFVRRPFLYSGVWYGLGGSLIALVIVAVTVLVLSGPVQRITGLYGSDFRLTGLSWETTLWLIGAGVALGWLGSFIAANRHLRAIEPK
jgi:cell division transport system permease protein